nr:hypothetical protein BaRGS_028030 [Batillaria attramentaria]
MDNSTGDWHVQLACGHFLNTGNPPVSVVWTATVKVDDLDVELAVLKARLEAVEQENARLSARLEVLEQRNPDTGVQQHQQGAANKARQAEDQVGGIQ